MEEIKQFLKSKGFTQSSIDTYESVLNKVFKRLGRKFTEGEVESFLTWQNLSPRSYNLYRTIINFYTTKYLSYSLEFKKAKVPNSLPNYITREEINKVLYFTKNIKHKLGLSIIYSSGLRIYELVRLKKHDFDFENFEIIIKSGKGNKDRNTMLKPSLVPIIKKYLIPISNNSNPYFFQTYRGHISERSFEEVLKRGILKAGISKHFTLHDLRHSFAINCLDNGVDIEDVRRMLGHSSLRTTQIYLQCKRTNLKAIAMRLEQNITK